MRKVHFVDTSILLNLLDVPNKNAHANEVAEELDQIIDAGEKLILPVATVIETGNHIAQAEGGGQVKRKLAEKFANYLTDTADGKAPWSMSTLVWDADALHRFAQEFLDHAMCGTGIGDLSIINEFEKYQKGVPGVSIRIWSKDTHLIGYDYTAPEIGRRRRR